MSLGRASLSNCSSSSPVLLLPGCLLLTMECAMCMPAARTTPNACANGVAALLPFCAAATWPRVHCMRVRAASKSATSITQQCKSAQLLLRRRLSQAREVKEETNTHNWHQQQRRGMPAKHNYGTARRRTRSQTQIDPDRVGGWPLEFC